MIRHAIESDVPRIVEMGKRFLRESPYQKHFIENPAKIEELVRCIMASKGGVLVAERDGQIIGMLGFIVYPHFISGETVGGEVAWWVEPEARGEGLKLLRQAEREAKEAGAVSMQMIAPDERVAAVYERLGYQSLETTFQRAL